MGAVPHRGPVGDVRHPGHPGHAEGRGRVDRAGADSRRCSSASAECRRTPSSGGRARCSSSCSAPMPVLILMIFAYFAYSRYDIFPSEYATLAGVVTGLTLYNGAVIAEIVRAGVNALAARPVGGRRRRSACAGVRPCGRSCSPRPSRRCCRCWSPSWSSCSRTRPSASRSRTSNWSGQAQNIGAQYSNYIPALMVIAVVYDPRELQPVLLRDLARGADAAFDEGRTRCTSRR